MLSAITIAKHCIFNGMANRMARRDMSRMSSAILATVTNTLASPHCYAPSPQNTFPPRYQSNAEAAAALNDALAGTEFGKTFTFTGIENKL